MVERVGIRRPRGPIWRRLRSIVIELNDIEASFISSE